MYSVYSSQYQPVVISTCIVREKENTDHSRGRQVMSKIMQSYTQKTKKIQNKKQNKKKDVYGNGTKTVARKDT